MSRERYSALFGLIFTVVPVWADVTTGVTASELDAHIQIDRDHARGK